MEELANALGIEKPHVHFSEKIIHTKSDLKHRIHELKTERNKMIDA